MIGEWVRLDLEDVAQMIGEVAANLTSEFEDHKEQLFIGACIGWIIHHAGNRTVSFEKLNEAINMAYEDCLEGVI
jgi:uncharacterized OsmC-like protein